MNNNQPVSTVLVTNTSVGQPVAAPLAAQRVTGAWQYDIQTAVTPFGVNTPFDATTDDNGELTFYNMRMPAYWQFEMYPTKTCYSDISPYSPLTVISQGQALYPTSGSVSLSPTTLNFSSKAAPSENAVVIPCFSNTPNNPDFKVGDVSPSFALDDAYPSSVQVASLDPLTSAPQLTQLRLYSTNLAQVANVTATAIAGGGMSATFPYPNVPSGAYIGTIVSNPSGLPPSTDGMEPFLVGHDDTSFTGAYGVAVASPKEIYTYIDGYPRGTNPCGGKISGSDTTGGTPLPLVTLLKQGQLAIGSIYNTVSVGVSPTVVVPFNDHPRVVSTSSGACSESITTYSGAQSALVVNTGSNSVSIVKIGTYPSYPTGTVGVGSQPVAAVINAAETMAYVANYASNTVSEVNLSVLQQTRTLQVMQHPTSVTFDASGNLWVGGQGSMEEVNITAWNIASTVTVDGTINGLSYDAQQSSFVASVLQNGSATQPSNGTTNGNPISYNDPSQPSYATGGVFKQGSSTSTGTAVIADNTVYTSSPIASYLAFPAQNAFTPPIYSSSSGDLTATASGTTLTVSSIATGKVLIQGTLPYPARGIALTSNMLYVTMPESNSLVSLPIIP